MSTGIAKALLAFAIVVALGGCAGSKPQKILSAAELDSMILIEIRPLEADIPGTEVSDATAVAAVQP